MPRIASPYQAPCWLPGGHLQTCVPARCYRLPRVRYLREKAEMPDGDFMLFDWIEAPQAAAATPVLVHFHGLEGSSQSHYALALMQACRARGWRACVAHFRSCGGEMNRLRRSYFAGDTADCLWVLGRVHGRYPRAPLYAVGVSLGANQLAKCLGDLGEGLPFVTAAAAIGAPLDLAAGIPPLATGFGTVYTHMFMQTLCAKLREKNRRFPGAFPESEVARLRTLEDFDGYYTAPVHGFRSAADYYAKCSAKPVLRSVRRPLLLVNAENDPFQPAGCLPREQEVSSCVYREFSREGGHIGFPTRHWNDLAYLPGRVLRFFSAIA